MVVYVGKKENVNVDRAVSVDQDLNKLVEQAMTVMGVLNEVSAAQKDAILGRFKVLLVSSAAIYDL